MGTPMHFAAKLLSSTVAFAVAFSPMANAGQFVFRYKTQHTSVPETPLPEEEYGVGNDITAYYVAPVGVTFSKKIPVATHDVVLWVKDSGSWPDGIGIDDKTGAMSGSPTGNEKEALLYHGYDAQGHRIARARLNFTTFTPVGIGQQLDAYAHKGVYFYKEIPVPAGVDVYRWEPAGDLPEGVSMLGNAVQGTPPAAGEFGFAWRGFDYTGREIAYAYGELLVDDGPAMDPIADQTVQIDDAWKFNVTPAVSHPINPVRFRLVAETPQPSGLTFDSSTGHIGGVYAWYDLSATYHIVATDLVDGTEAKSNSFKLATAAKVLDLASEMKDITATVGKDFVQKVSVKDLPAGAVFSLKQGTWPEGISIDQSTGVISGKPAKIGTQADLVVSVTGPSMQPLESAPFAFKVVAEQVTATTVPLLKRVDEPFTSAGITLKSGNVAPLSFSTAAALPDGVTIDTDTGVITAPQGLAVAGSQGVPILVTNGHGQSATVLQPLEVLNALEVAYDNVTAKRLTTISLLPKVPANAIHGIAKYELSSDELPSWLAIDGKTGVIRGNPVDPASTGAHGPFTVTVSDSTGSVSAPSDPFFVTVEERDALSASVINGQVERFVPNQKATLKAVNTYKKSVFSRVSGNLGGTLSITPDGVLVGSTDDAVGTVYSGLVYDLSDADTSGVRTQTFSLSVVEPSALAPLTGSLDKTLTWTRGIPIPAGKLPLPQVKNGYGAVTYAFAASEPDLAIDPVTHNVTGSMQAAGTTTHVYTIDDETARPAASGTITLVMLDPLEALIATTTDIRRGDTVNIRPTVKNAIGQVTWQPSGTLPVGLRFENGAVTGVPRVEGSYPVSFNLSDEAGNSATASTTIVVGPALPFSVSWDDEAFVLGKNGIKNPAVSNPLGTVTYQILSGTLPDGLSLHKTGGFSGSIAGTPTESGRFKDIKIRATDSGIDASATSDDTVFDATIEVDVTLSGLPVFGDQTIAARKGVAFSKGLAASNLVAPWVFETDGGQPLPHDLVLNGTTGTITGRFDETGTYGPVDLKVIDDMGRSASADVRFAVLGGFSLETPQSAEFTQHVNGSVSVPTTNKLGPASYSLTSGALPSGLSVNRSTGTIEGKASETGDFSGIVISATDSDGAQASTDPFSIHVDPRPALTLDLPASYVFNQYFAGTVSAKGSNILDTAQWSISPDLPSWATFTKGAISGTSEVKMDATTYTVTLTDDHDTVSKQIDVSVGDRKPIEISTASAIPALMDYNFQKKLSTQDALGAVTWRLVSGTLPQGMDFLASSGAFEGKPTEYGTFGNIVIEVADEKGGSIQKSFTIDVKHDQSPIALTVTSASAHVGLAIAARAPTLDNAVGDLAFSATGLPAGLEIHPATGVVTGTPSAVGTYQVSVTVSDATGRSATEIQTITVLPPVSITVPSGTVGIIYNRDPSAAGHAAASNAVPENVWTLESGTLPRGLSIDPSTGTFAGKAKELGDFGPFTVRVVDSLGGTAVSGTMNLHVEMNGDPIILSVADYTTYLDKPITTAAPTFDNELGSVTFFSSDVAALGLSINPKTGVITGARSTLTDAYINVSIRDSGTQRVTSQPLRLRVVPELRITYPALMTSSQGASFSQIASIGNNIGTITYRKGAGAWPDSFAVNAQTGAITGTDISADAKTYPGLTVAADVVFNGGQTDSQYSNSFSITVNPIQATPVISDIDSTAANRAALFTVGSAGTTINPTVVDSAKGKAWTYSGTTYSLNHDIKADTGLDFDPKTGTISGTATNPFLYKDLTITVTSAQGDSDTTAPFWLGVQPSGPIVATAGQPTWFGTRADKTTVIPGPKFDNTFGKLTFTSVQGITTNFDTTTGAYTQFPFANSAVTSQPLGGWPEDIRVTDELGRTAVFSAKWELMYALTVSATASVGVPPDVSGTYNQPTVSGLYGSKSFTGVGMPTGMSINASTGELIGTPLSADKGKSFPVTITVTDSRDGSSSSFTYTVTVVGEFRAVAGQQTTWPVRIGGQVVMASPKFEGAVGSVTFSKVSGDNALGVNATTGQVTALSSTAGWVQGTFPVVIRARDSNARTADLTIYIKTVGPLALRTTGVSLEIDKAVISLWPPVTTNAGDPTYTATGLPPGITVDPKTGALSGTATVAGKYTVTMTVTDFDGATAASTFPVVVSSGGTPHRYWKVTFKPGTSSFSSIYEVELHGSDNTNYAPRALSGTASATAGAPYQPGNSLNSVASRLWDGVHSNWYSFKPGTDGRVTVEFDFKTSPVYVEYLRYLSSGAAYPAETATDAKVFWSDDSTNWTLGFEAGDTVVAPGPGTSSDRTVMR